MHFHWPQKPRFVRLPKDKHQLDAQPITFFHGGSKRGAKPLSGRGLAERERAVREREERVEKRECDVRLRENRVWEGLKEVARGKVAVAVLEARVRELEERLRGGRDGERWARRGGGAGAGCGERDIGKRQWWTKGWWSF